MLRSPVAALLCSLLVSSSACIDDTQRPDTTSDVTAPDENEPETGEPDGDPGDSGPSDDAADGSAPDTSESCPENGVTRCAPDANATDFCNDGVWVRAECGDDRLCVNAVAGAARCIDDSGEGVCRDAFYCFLTCGVVHDDDPQAGESCFVGCFIAATREAQRELNDTIGCFEDNCHDSADAIACAAERCSQDLADCYFDTKGDALCASIVECRLACGDDEACARGCGGDATIDAQGDYAVLELCTFYACVGQDDDCPRRVSLPTGPCGPYANACIGLLPNTPR